MQGAPRRSARSFFALPLVLALLALAAFPVFAHAGAIPEYEVEVPHVGSEAGTHPKNHKIHQAEEHSAKAHGSNVSPETESGEGESKKSHGGGVGTGDNGGGNSQSNGGGGNGSKSSAGTGGGNVSTAKKVSAGTADGTQVSHGSGGSSPVVPILIAVVVLAAISIGVVLYRQRKGQGPDGSVSSSNAS